MNLTQYFWLKYSPMITSWNKTFSLENLLYLTNLSLVILSGKDVSLYWWNISLGMWVTWWCFTYVLYEGKGIHYCYAMLVTCSVCFLVSAFNLSWGPKGIDTIFIIVFVLIIENDKRWWMKTRPRIWIYFKVILSVLQCSHKLMTLRKSTTLYFLWGTFDVLVISYDI